MATDQKISALTNYTTPLDADVIPVVDTANTTTKKTTWANFKATLKTYFDSLYSFPYGAYAYRTTSAQSIPNTTQTKIQLNAEQWDFSNEFDSTTNFRYTALTTGYYQVSYQIYWPSATSGSYYQTVLQKNGMISGSTVGVVVSVPGGGQDVAGGGSVIVQLTAGDYLEMYGYQNSGSTATVFNFPGYTYLAIQRIK